MYPAGPEGLKIRSVKAAGAVLAVIVAALVVIGFWYTRAPRATQVRVGETAPDVQLPAQAGGRPVKLSEFRAPAVLLVILDTRWPEAPRYLTELERLHRRYLQKGLRVVGVALDEPSHGLRAALSNMAVTFTVLEDPGGRALGPVYGRPRGPEAYLVARGGAVQAVYVDRVNWRAPEVSEQIERLLPRGR